MDKFDKMVKHFCNGRDDTYETELMGFGRELHTKFDAEPEFEVYTGGVLGMSARLKIEDYEEAKKWLIEKFGQPEQKEPWHPNHTKKCPPLRFTIREPMENQKMDHAHLISMMQRADKQYVLVTWM